jgi:hypothetical protein
MYIDDIVVLLKIKTTSDYKNLPRTFKISYVIFGYNVI